MKLFRLNIIVLIVLVCLTTVAVMAQFEPPNQAVPPEALATPTLPGHFEPPNQAVPPEALVYSSLPRNMETALVACTAESTGPCDQIATSAEDIVGVWKQYLQGSFFNAPGEVAYIRFNLDGTFTMADSIENTAQPFQNYPTGTFKFDGQHWSTPLVLNDSVPAPCVLETDAYQARVLKYGDQPVALRFVFVSDGCAGRVSDYTQTLVWVAD